MIKELKKILSSPLLIITFSASLLIIFVNFLIYQSSDFDYMSKYDVVYSENIEDYYEEINKYNNLILSMDEKTFGYEYYKNHYIEMVKIYDELVNNNIEYSTVYDFGYGNINDRSVYLYLSNSFMLLIIVINVISIVYLAFTRDFDNSRYAFLYGSDRKKLLLNKIISSFLIVLVLFLTYFLINFIFSLKFDIKYQNVLIVSDKAYFMKVFEYLIKYVFCHLLYNMIVLFLVFWIFAILFKKTINFFIFILVAGVLLFIFPFTNYLFSYMGMAQMYEIISFELIGVAKIFVIVPIGILIIEMFLFNKIDL